MSSRPSRSPSDGGGVSPATVGNAASTPAVVADVTALGVPRISMINPRLWLYPILSVAWKEIRVTTRYKTWFVASFVWPIIFPFSFIFVGRGLAGPSGEGLANFTALAQTADYASFLIVGNLVWMFVNINLWMGGLSLTTDRARGTFDTHWTMPTSKISLVMGATIASIVLNFIPMIVAILFYSWIGWLTVSGSFLNVVVAVLTVIPFLFGFLLCFSAATIRFREAGMIVQVLRTLFSLLCGLQFPLAVLPGAVQSVGRVIPLTHFIDVIRGIVLNGNTLSAHADSIRYLLISGGIFVVLGLGIFELVRRSVRRRGLVTGY
jgi:ABC-2 type transport system permease protein